MENEQEYLSTRNKEHETKDNRRVMVCPRCSRFCTFVLLGAHCRKVTIFGHHWKTCAQGLESHEQVENSMHAV